MFPTALTLPLLAVALASAADAQTVVPGDKSLLYYRIGGGEPVSRPANPGMSTLRIGLGGTARLNYSCGRFDVGLTIQNLMNGFASMGTTITGGVRAGIAALPLYILQRANPGLYELFQTYQRKAEAEWNIALKSCEEMEAQIKQGGDPYAEWISMAKGEHWKSLSYSTTDAVSAKQRAETDGGINGLTWIGGVRRGGRGQAAIEVIHDIAQAGYNVTMMRPPGASPVTVFPSTGPAATKLTRAFPSPKLAADWAVSVVGDRQIALCDEPGCQPKAASPGSGLLAQYEVERPQAETQLQAVIAGAGTADYGDLDKASAPGIAITREVVDALRAMPPAQRQLAVSRLAMEVAQARVIDKALMVRNLLLTGGGVPEAGWEPAQKELRDRIDQWNRHMDDLLFETRMRREIVSATAKELLEAYRAERPVSGTAPPEDGADRRPLENGRVR